MYALHFRCHDCDSIYPVDELRYRCESCDGPLDIIYDYQVLEGELSWQVLKSRGFNHYRYHELYPTTAEELHVSMGEGGTPLIPAATLSDTLGADVYLKMESQNPTGSFKDRGTATEISKALEHNAREVVVASTGNMGSSIAAYAARAGIPATIYIPAGTSGAKRKQMESYGATLVEVDGGYEHAAKKAYEQYEDESTYLMGDYAYRGEGEKSVGYELVDQASPDTVVLPIGNGTLTHGVWKAFTEFKRLNLIQDRPRIIGVQATGCNTVVNAFDQGWNEVEPVNEADTVAGAIACADPLDGAFALDALQESNGFGVAVTDEEIMDAKQVLAEEEGVYAEEAAAAPLAAALKNPDMFDQGETVVLAITGHGLKT